MSHAVLVSAMGAEGEGLATGPDGAALFIPGVLPGETVRVARPNRVGKIWRATAESVETASPDRVRPPCSHFGVCGGCALQHWRAEAYQSWKTSLLRHALDRAGFGAAEIGALVTCSAGTRRRVDLAARRVGRRVTLGLHPARSHEIVDLTECLVLDPALTALLPGLRELLADLAWRDASVIINRLDTGLDVLLRATAEPALPDRTRLIQFARHADLARLSWGGASGEPEPIIVLRPPVITFSGVPTRPPPGAFLQATTAGEAAILAAILPHVPERARVVEFHAGCGTITFALAAKASVRAWEGDQALVTALREAANRAGLGGQVRAEARDLVRQPVRAEELKGTDVIVLDPPHAGAERQMPAIATSGVGTVIYVSCNPAALARDAAGLAVAGYRLVAATPIDQFLYSPRLESVSVFRLAPSRGKSRLNRGVSA
jgi:23S rRNA (uracil1939-C5)-methyltransferase